MASQVLKMPLLSLSLLIFHHFTTIFSLSSSSYIIHMNLSAMPKPFSDHHNWYLSTISSIKTSRKSKHIYSYSNSIHGFSAYLTKPELESLKKSPGYVSCTKDRRLKLHTTHTSQFLGLSPFSGVWPATNSGEDMIIGLVDTGIWPESESFTDEGFPPVPSRWKGRCVQGNNFNVTLCNKKVIGANFFNKGLLANNPNLKISANSPRDTSGHGTHTASIAAGSYVKGASYFGYASGTARGMAPRARLAMYKAVWENGVFESDVLAAIDQAIRDGVDVLSLSLALENDEIFLDHDPIAVATFAAVQKGIFVIASGGNDGPGFYTLVNGAPWLTTVGAGTIDREFGGVLTLGDGREFSFGSLYPGNYSLTRKKLVFLGGCGNVEEMRNVKGSIVVCKGSSGLSDQVENAEKEGVLGAVLIGDFSMSESYIRTSFQAAFIGFEDGEKIVEYTQKGNDPSGTMVFKRTTIGTKPAPEVEGFSSRGPFSSCPYVLKPDLIAPGSLVLASWSPVNSVAKIGSKPGPLFSKFNLLSGTSMAAPHVAGVASLVKKAHPSWTPAAIRSALMTTSSPLDNTRSPIKDSGNNDTPASPLAMGSGHIDPSRALDPGLVYDATTEDYMKLLCAMKYTKRQIQVITKYSNPSCVNASLDLNYPSFVAYFNGDSGGETEFSRTLTNVGDGLSSYSAKVTGLSGVKVIVEPEKLEFKSKNEKLGFKLRLEVEGPKLEEMVVHGSLLWVHDEGKHTIRSPIVATTLVPESS